MSYDCVDSLSEIPDYKADGTIETDTNILVTYKNNEKRPIYASSFNEISANVACR